jgi:hypothetical protein
MRDDLSHRSRLGRPRQGAGPREMYHRRPRHVPVEPLSAQKLSVGAVCTVSKTRGFAEKLQDYWDPSACMTRSSSATPRSSPRNVQCAAGRHVAQMERWNQQPKCSPYLCVPSHPAARLGPAAQLLPRVCPDCRFERVVSPRA